MKGHGYLKTHQSYVKNCKNKERKKMTPLTVKNEFSKNVKSLQFPMVQGSLNPNIIFLCEKL